ncbi:hypothetical protein A2U01_0087751, partial [Trifolium medium]|nr:hypothetical protein [Trifolium medium]
MEARRCCTKIDRQLTVVHRRRRCGAKDDSCDEDERVFRVSVSFFLERGKAVGAGFWEGQGLGS